MMLATFRRQLLPNKNVCQRLCSSSSTSSTHHDEFTKSTQDQKANEDQRTRDDDEDEAIKTKILSSSLQFVPAYGWTREAVEAGTETLGYPTVTAGVIHDAGIQLIHHHMTTANSALEVSMKAESAEGQALFLNTK